ncbi:hypothetical protein [Nostoc sp. UHCC 0251]|uniref:hypothetical protein n=1 Tax=Nostoc sp. UHCC 0251 TaxID=3110240 RepID=UPI002B1ED352|nr:hypothetical protein [Nostoc sp. UHCC 0251]MEA5621771.1 hypothetical protein [Nostoc sp. UHCC 0251]
MRKTTIFTLTLLSLAILPAMAQVQLGSGLGEVWTNFKLYSADMGKYFQNNLSENLKPVEVQSRNALDSAKGDTELKIPNPVAAGQKVRENIINESYRSESKASRFENNPAVRANGVSNEVNRLITRGAAEAILGKDGQNRTQVKLENTQNTLEEIDAISEMAGSQNNLINSKFGRLIGAGQNRTTGGIANTATNAAANLATGNITEALSLIGEILGENQLQTIKIQRAQSAIIGETFAQTIQTNQSLQYSNLNLANISQQSEEANRARRVDTSTEAARLLRATSQLDLFGRELRK